MDLHLRGKRALVTGSTAGIGFATALGLAREGAAVVVNGRTCERADEAAERIRKMVPGAQVQGVATFVERMADKRGADFETMEKEFFEHTRPSSLLRRFATVEEVANMIVYVCSEAASATNGAALRVDCGVVRAIG
jgi:NAD(P)-dependent dehydrogenase (short-subunit alcohol dehydrogenase family)